MHSRGNLSVPEGLPDQAVGRELNGESHRDEGDEGGACPRQHESRYACGRAGRRKRYADWLRPGSKRKEPPDDQTGKEDPHSMFRGSSPGVHAGGCQERQRQENSVAQPGWFVQIEVGERKPGQVLVNE
jgi:hypothetical protein